jgi:thiosulfate dehydrogenase
MNSYNKGAGMYKTKTLAGFVKKNMPVGDETLTDQEALDVAAYINFQFRPYDPRKGVIGFLAR